MIAATFALGISVARRRPTLLWGGLLAVWLAACTGAPPPAATPTPASAEFVEPTPQATVPSPAGLRGRIVYHARMGTDNQIFVLDLATGRTTQLTSTGDNLEPAWSPDGRQIVFACSVGEFVQLCVMDADGGNRRQLTDRKSMNFGPDWSPDGKRIVFVSNEHRPYAIYLLELETGQVRRVLPNQGNESAPKWSPDGSRILYAANRQMAFGKSFIFSVKPDGTDERQLTTFGRDDRPAWSPDGKRIVFRRELFQSSLFSGVEIVIQEIDGKDARPLTANRATDDWPEFSPDGEWIVYSTDAGNDSELMVIPAKGGNPSPIVPNGVRGRAPRWHR
jgi:Tol biopolymer transport system component